MKKIWEKGKKISMNKKVEDFLSADNIVFDQKMIVYDIYGSLAHLHGLLDNGILNLNEYQKMKSGLKNILKMAKQNKIKIKVEDEDVHTTIENLLFQKIGPLAGKLHTLRSRNDQVLVDIRLYTKEHLLNIMQLTLDLAQAFLVFAKKHKNLPMPGYTHLQKAMISSVGLWGGSFVESLINDLEVLIGAYKLNNQSPLGSAAGYGTPLPINRKLVAKLLGFAKVQSNPLYCQNSRGKIELNVIHGLLQILQTLNKFSSDILLFTSSEFNYFSLPDNFLTGSSIMPQKKNYDVMEMIRAKYSQLVGNFYHLSSLITNLPSGYNRDFQEIKKPLFSSLDTASETLLVIKEVVKNIKPNQKKLVQSISSELLVTPEVYKLVKRGMPFRQAYQKIGQQYFDNLLIIKNKSFKLPLVEFSSYSSLLAEYKKFIITEKKSLPRA